MNPKGEMALFCILMPDPKWNGSKAPSRRASGRRTARREPAGIIARRPLRVYILLSLSAGDYTSIIDRSAGRHMSPSQHRMLRNLLIRRRR